MAAYFCPNFEVFVLRPSSIGLSPPNIRKVVVCRYQGRIGRVRTTITCRSKTNAQRFPRPPFWKNGR